MIKILFICHGNICRSPAAEIIMKKLVEEASAQKAFYIESAATSTEEIGNPIYPPMRKVLSAHGYDCSGKTARQINDDDIDRFDLIIGMDNENMYMLHRRYGDSSKLKMLMDFAGKPGQEVFDPWYSRDFERSFREISEGCEGLLREIVIIDFSACESREELYAVLRREMQTEDWYGNNLDALHDIVTGLPHRGEYFAVIPPEKPELKSYAAIMEEILNRRED